MCIPLFKLTFVSVEKDKDKTTGIEIYGSVSVRRKKFRIQDPL
jgi:hypothetical protein